MGRGFEWARDDESHMRFKVALTMLLILWITPTTMLAGPLTVKDMAGRTINLKAVPRRIICLGPGALRLIVYLEAQDLLVGVESMEKQYPTGRPYWIANPQLKTLPAIGPGGAGAINKKPDKEILLSLNPDVIFIDGAGLPLVREDYRKKPDFYQALAAVKAKRVYTLYPFNYYTTNLDTAMVDAYAIGKILYPEGFADVDLVKQVDAIYTFLVGKPVTARMQVDFGALGQSVRFDD
jgi:ABC-type Fe3+-hydroxamate transport system substrate-binding protein